MPERQLLLKGEGPVRVGSRALEILLALVERPGELLTKGELMARVWPDVVVDEGNLRTQVALLRRALNDGEDGSRYIIAVPGRGYRFVAPVEGVAPQVMVPAPTLATHRLTQPLLRPGSRVIGRERVIADVAKRLERHRFLTIVGPGGIGKTTVWGAARFDETAGCGRGHRNRRSDRWTRTTATSPWGRRRAPRTL
ncbi:transcriptional regulator, partial [Dankookia sp. GCM10030260]|uniref:winged helix-turn-helix domain-containing protein n=1 Tax=Dankookia sp. GCM10030260 TaxID=3273390 RepID=UPI003608C231